MDTQQDSYFYSSRGRKSWVTEKQYNRALVSNLRGIKLNQGEKKKYYRYFKYYEEKGLIQIAQKNQTKGIKSLRKVLKFSYPPNMSYLSEQIGIAYMEMSLYREAIKEFETALSFNYKGKKLNYYWGLCLENLQTKQKAVAKFQQSEKKLPFFICFQRNHSLVLDKIDKGDFQSAEKQCKALLKINKNFVYAYFNRVIALFCQDKIDKGMRTFFSIYFKLPKAYPKLRKIVRKYKKYLRKSQKQLQKSKDRESISLLKNRIQAIERLLGLFEEQSPEKSRLYTIFIPNIVLSILVIFIVGIVFLLLFC